MSIRSVKMAIASAVMTISLTALAAAHPAHNRNTANTAPGANMGTNTNTGANANTAEQGHGQHAAPEKVERVEEFPTYHPLVVHFPIMLLLMAAVFQLVSLAVIRREMGWIVLTLAAIGVIAAWLASNPFHPHTAGLSESAQKLLSRHELYADLTFWFGLAGVIAKGVSVFLNRPWWSEITATLLLSVAATAVSITGHHGAELVHKEGVGPQGQFLEAEQDH